MSCHDDYLQRDEEIILLQFLYCLKFVGYLHLVNTVRYDIYRAGYVHPNQTLCTKISFIKKLY